MGSLKIRNGTRSTDAICPNCRHAHIIKGPAESDEAVFCHFREDEPLPFTVVECNRFDDRRTKSWQQYINQSWPYLTDPDTGRPTFLHPARYEQFLEDGKVKSVNHELYRKMDDDD